jgi:hypothetical protein
MSYGKLPLVCFCAAASIAATARAQAQGSEVEIVFGPNPGEIIFDATKLKTVLPYPASPRQFADEGELFDFMLKVLNAEPFFDGSTGELIGFAGTVETWDEPCVTDWTTNACVPVASALTAFLGGEAGYIVVGKDTICIDETKCGSGEPARTMSRLSAFAMAEFQISGGSFAFGSTFRQVGTTTRQVAGGYRRFEEICEWELFGYHCWDERGWNNLKTESFFTDDEGRVLAHPTPAWCGNCMQVSQASWGVSVSLTKPKAPPWIYKGVYGWHYGEGAEGKESAGSCTATGCYYGP